MTFVGRAAAVGEKREEVPPVAGTKLVVGVIGSPVGGVGVTPLLRPRRAAAAADVLKEEMDDICT